MLISLNFSNRIVGLMILKKKSFFIFYKILFIMRILKSHPLLKLVNSYLIDASQPSNISYA
jgi:ubiquinol-cytochrome c reductase cytochrome b subunit